MFEHIGHLALAALRDHGHAIEGLIHHCIVSSAVGDQRHASGQQYVDNDHAEAELKAEW